ncbi:MAG: hypothetical protein Q9217_004746 [Psora testacea]
MSGAGISVNAGIPDYQTLRKSEKSSFDISVYNSAADTARFLTMVCNLSRQSSQAKPTAFHCFLDGFASNGRLIRHYTQNIDCIEHRLPNLGERTVQLHGRIDEAVYKSCGWRTSFLPTWFCGSDLPDCTRCQGVALERERMGQRQRGIGRLRPNVVLYGEDNPSGHIIGELAERDIKTGPDAIFMVGTALKVPGAKKLARKLCRAVKARGGVTVSINKDDAYSPHVSFTAVIERLESDKLHMISELKESNNHIAEAIELKDLAEREVAHFKSIAQAIEIDNEKLQQEVKTLTEVVEHFKSTTVKSLDEFTNNLKFGLNLFAAKTSSECPPFK